MTGSPESAGLTALSVTRTSRIWRDYMKKPEPINKHIVCSLCGLDWEKHGANPTIEKCVGLLKAELASRPLFRSNIIGSGSNWYGNLTTQ
jgi:hypothetical protein